MRLRVERPVGEEWKAVRRAWPARVTIRTRDDAEAAVVDPRPASAAVIPSDPAWHVAGGPDKLRTWALAWGDGGGYAGLFQLGLLDDLFVLAGHCYDGGVIAGAVAGRSDRSVGDSNVLALDEGTETAWPRVLDGAHRHCRWSAMTAAMAWRPRSAVTSSRSVRCGSGCTADGCPVALGGTARRRMRCIARRRGVLVRARSGVPRTLRGAAAVVRPPGSAGPAGGCVQISSACGLLRTPFSASRAERGARPDRGCGAPVLCASRGQGLPWVAVDTSSAGRSRTPRPRRSVRCACPVGRPAGEWLRHVGPVRQAGSGRMAAPCGQ